jgi:hypothetical protein
VEQRVEHITYLEGKVVVEWSLRYYDERGELVSTGLIAEEVDIPKGGSVEGAVNEARRRLNERIGMIREEWRRRGAAPVSPV